MVKKIKGTYVFKVTADDGSVHEWFVDLKTGNGCVNKGKGLYIHIICDSFIAFLFLDLKGDCIIFMKDSDLMDMASGKLTGQKVETSIFWFLHSIVN